MSCLPLLPSRQQETVTVDRYATEVAKMAMTGDVTEAEAKGFLSSLLLISTVPQKECSTFLFAQKHAYPQPIADLQLRVTDLLQRKVESGYISLAKIAAGSSFSGCCREFLRSKSGCKFGGIQSEWRNLCVQYHHDVPSSHLLQYDGGPMPANTAATKLVDVAAGTPDEVLHDELLSAAAASFEDRKYTMRPLATMVIAAQALNEMYHLPQMAKPTTCDEREAVQAAIDAEPKAVFRVMASLLRKDFVDSPLLALFDDFTMDDIETLAEADPKVALMLAQAAVSAVPPTSKKVAAELSRQFVALASTVEQSRTAKQVVRTWLDMTSTMLGDEYNQWQWKEDGQIEMDAAAFHFQVTRLLRSGMGGFPGTVQVEAWLAAASDQIAAVLSEVTVDVRNKTAAHLRGADLAA